MRWWNTQKVGAMQVRWWYGDGNEVESNVFDIEREGHSECVWRWDHEDGEGVILNDDVLSVGNRGIEIWSIWMDDKEHREWYSNRIQNGKRTAWIQEIDYTVCCRSERGFSESQGCGTDRRYLSKLVSKSLSCAIRKSWVWSECGVWSGMFLRFWVKIKIWGCE